MVGTKTISIMDDVYEHLIALKTPGESFSEELRRLTGIKGDIMDLAGSWDDVSEEKASEMKSKIAEMRKGSRLKKIKEKMV